MPRRKPSPSHPPLSPDPYAEWVGTKARAPQFGSAPRGEIAESLFPHQRVLVEWALRKGRAAIFADTGLGKTLMQLEWARHVSSAGRVLVLAPLAVKEQTAAEGRRFGIDVTPLRRDDGESRIVVANYEMAEHFDPDDFVGVVLDESSILKSFDGATRNMLISRFAATPFRLACTATPAPNDFTELGNHSEFLGVKTRTEMLAEYFVHDGGKTQDWRVKGHAVGAFWTWVAGWGAVVRTPADLGFDDDRYSLPPLNWHEHVIEADHRSAWRAGLLFADAAHTIADQRAIRRATADERAALASSIAAGDEPCIVWCEFNAESKAVAAAIPDAVEVAGADDPDTKADRLLGFADGKYRVIVTKASIAGFGMNWQRCAQMVFMGASHSYEQTYQAIRRCWRFGQSRPVDVHVIRAEQDAAIVANYRRKEADALTMSARMTERARAALLAEIRSTSKEWNPYQPTTTMVVPEWIGREDSP